LQTCKALEQKCEAFFPTHFGGFCCAKKLVLGDSSDHFADQCLTQKSSTFPQKSPICLQKSPIFPHKSRIFPHKDHFLTFLTHFGRFCCSKKLVLGDSSDHFAAQRAWIFFGAAEPTKVSQKKRSDFPQKRAKEIPVCDI